MAHTCSTLVLHCIDFRFGKAIKEYLTDRRLLGDCDIVSVAGAAKNLVSPKNESDREFVLYQIGIAQMLHHIARVVLINHTDCGAYGGRAAFPITSEEQGKHTDDLRAAAKLIAERYPDLKTELVLAHIEESGDIHFEKIA